MKVTLTWSEVAIAARVGEARTIRNRAKGNGHRHGKAPGADWSTDIEAACAEVAAAKALGVYMPITTTPDEDRHGDLGYGIHVRSTQHDDGRLILHRDDPDDGLFVLVVGKSPHFTLPGFLRGADGKIDAHWHDPTGEGRAAFFVPQNALHDTEGLAALRPVPLPPDWLTAYERKS